MRRVVLIVDDHPLYRQALCQLLSHDVTMEVAADVGTAAEAIEVMKRQSIDLTIIDVVLPAVGGIALTRRVKDTQPQCKVLALSMLDDAHKIAEMLRSGADGYVIKTQTHDEIAQAIASVCAGNRYLPPTVDPAHVQRLLEGPGPWPLETLTLREREVYDLLVQGNTNDQVATKLNIARRTVETHRLRVMKKLSARSMVDLVRMAFKYAPS